MIRFEARLPCGDRILDAAWESAGRVTGLFGPSGAGKTTLLRALAGLTRPLAGRIEVDGRVLFDSARGIDVPAHRRELGYVFQDHRLFPHLSVRENLAFAQRAGGAGPGVELSPDEVADRLDLRGLLARRADTLSGGEARRVAIGRALASRPRLLLLDEPLTGLDLPRREHLLDLLVRLLDRFRLPAVYVSHTLADFLAVAETAVPVRDGRAGPAGPVSRILEDFSGGAGAATLEAVCRGVVRGSGPDEGLVEVVADGVPILVSAARPPPAGSTVLLRLSARDVLLARDPGRWCSARNRIPARIEAVHPFGLHLLVSARTATGLLLHAEVSRSAARELDLSPGMETVALFKANAVGLDRLRPV